MNATANSNRQPRQRRAWAPDGDDHLIFELVKMKGRTQEDVAHQLGISQATVSRVLDRYGRWQAHAKERDGGRLDHAERRRAQRVWTYERNELILASCLRIAGQVECFRTTAKTTVDRGTATEPEHTSRTQYEEVDRRGVAARFLRLAFRVNMEQHKLCEQDPLPALPPLTVEQIAEEEVQAAAATAEIRAANQATIDSFNRQHAEDMEQRRETERLKQIEEAERAELVEQLRQQREAEERGQEPGAGDQEPEPAAEQSVTDQPAPDQPVVNKVHKVHKPQAEDLDVTTDGACCCAVDAGAEKNHADCMAGPGDGPPPRPSPRLAARRKRHSAAVSAVAD